MWPYYYSGVVKLKGGRGGQRGAKTPHQASKKGFSENLSKYLKFVGLLSNIFRFDTASKILNYATALLQLLS